MMIIKSKKKTKIPILIKGFFINNEKILGIEPVVRMYATLERLLRVGDVPGWSKDLHDFMDGNFSLPRWKAAPTLSEQTDAVGEIYRGLVNE